MIFKIGVALILFYCINGDPMDYKGIIDNLHIEYYNDTMAAPNATYGFFKYNRTQAAINVSLWILQDLDGNMIESSTKVYAFMSNTFKFSGVELKVPNVCKMWQDDLYGIRGIMLKCGDVDLCNIKKGHWHLDNCWPTESVKYLPKSAPQGSYKVTMESRMLDGSILASLAFYGRASLYFKEMKGKPKPAFSIH